MGTKQNTNELLKQTIDTLSEYMYLADCSPVEFLTENYWQLLPVSHQDYILTLSYDDLLLLVSNEFQFPQDSPDGLKNMRKTVENATIDRNYHDHVPWKLDHDIIHPVLFNKMKPKKKYEVECLAPLIAEVIKYSSKKSGETQQGFIDSGQDDAEPQATVVAIDIGAGNGYIPRILAGSYGFRSVCLDNKYSTIMLNSLHRIQHLATKYAKHRRNSELKHHYELVLDQLIKAKDVNISTEMKLSDISGIVNECFHDIGNDLENSVLIGLHACGDLSVTMIRLFLESKARSLINVGCCFQHVSTKYICDNFQDDRPIEDKCFPPDRAPSYVTTDKYRRKGFEKDVQYFRYGFPLSVCAQKCFEGVGLVPLPRRVLSMTCHSVDSYTQNVLEAADLRTALDFQFNRAFLQVILRQEYKIDQELIILGKNPECESNNIVRYCQLSLENLGLAPIANECIMSYWDKYKNEKAKYDAWWCLRISLAPLVESMILLDRLAVLKEHGMEATLIPIFDPTISPRNHVLIASKSNVVSCITKDMANITG